MVGIAFNFSANNSFKKNYLSDNKYSLLANSNETISKNGIWREAIISENLERYLLEHDKVIKASVEWVHKSKKK